MTTNQQNQPMRRLFSRAAMTLLMMLLTTASAWADPTFLTRGDGEGTEGNPYKITNANDLMDLSVYVNGSGSYSDNTTESTNHPCDGVYFQQTADINLSGSFHPIGDHVNNRSFSGHYDGGPYAITGLHVEGSYQHAGLFGRLLRATVKNVRLVSPTVISTANQGNGYAGALVGSTQTINNEAYRVTIENCLVINPTVSFTYPSTGRWAGAIVGSIGGSADSTTAMPRTATQPSATPSAPSSAPLSHATSPSARTSLRRRRPPMPTTDSSTTGGTTTATALSLSSKPLLQTILPADTPSPTVLMAATTGY